jgi:ABC-type branched-subunit amino acid transport system ATPase component
MTGLEVSGLSVTYGGLVANDRVSLSVGAGQVVGLIGPNGAGKSTFVDAVSGFVRYTGSIILNGQVLDALPPHERVRAGLTRTWQSGELLDDLTVRDIISLGTRRTTWATLAADALRPCGRGDRAAADRVLEMFGLAASARCRPTELSLGRRKLLGVARAVLSGPQAVLLDEPAAGLDTEERQQLDGHIRSLAKQGLAVLLIDHDVSLVLGVCDAVTVLDFGRVIATGAPAEIRRHPPVIEAYLGEVA